MPQTTLPVLCFGGDGWNGFAAARLTLRARFARLSHRFAVLGRTTFGGSITHCRQKKIGAQTGPYVFWW
jgi:hypothetical protein